MLVVLRSKAAAFLDRHAADWRYAHKMWSVWMVLVTAALNAAYASIYAIQTLVSPIHFVMINVGLCVVVTALRLLNQENVPGA